MKKKIYTTAYGFGEITDNVKKMILAVLIVLLPGAPAFAQLIYALADKNLVSFNAATPGLLINNVPITGIVNGQQLAGLDFRPNTGELYALGYNKNNGNAQLYVINRATGVAGKVHALPTMLMPDMGKICFDFNPTVDRIRVTGSNKGNYRLHPVTGLIAAIDINQAYAVGDMHEGAKPSVSTLAYTRSYIGATTTMLFAYDDSLNILALQNPPNNGTLNTIGASGIMVNAASTSIDMDIYFDVAAGHNIAYLAANTGTEFHDHLYTINLETGATSDIGEIGSGLAVRNIAVFINRAVPSVINGSLIYAVTATNNLISFDSEVPTIIRSIVPVTGITVGQQLSGTDFRPNTGQYYALGYNQANGESQLYVVNTTTGVATAVNSVPTMLQPNMGKIGFDFNPTVDRIRVTGSNNANYRLHPVTGLVAAIDLNLQYATGDINQSAEPSIGAVAYSNSYIGTTTTALYDYDDSLNVLALQNPPNNGTLNTLGSLGFKVNSLDQTTDMDIYYNSKSNSNQAYIAINTGNYLVDKFYEIDLVSNTATSKGFIGFGIAIKDIAAFIDRTIPTQITGQLLYALTANNNLLSFDSDLPGIIRSSVAVTGITLGQLIAGTDFRPATGELFAIGYNSVNGQSQLYIINTATGIASAVNTTPTMLEPAMGKIGFDFNPTVDKIRVTGSNNANYRLDPLTGLIAATDSSLAYAVGDANENKNPSIGAVAYTNSFAGATVTALFDYDDSLNVIAYQFPPNNGTLITIGSSGIKVNKADQTTDMDIYYHAMSATNIAYLTANTFTKTSDKLYTVNLTTGMTTNYGFIGNGIAVADIAAYISPSASKLSTSNSKNLDNQLTTYPNPASDQVNFSFEVSDAAYAQIVITDLLGKPVTTALNTTITAGQHSGSMPLIGIAPGIYFINLYLNNKLEKVSKLMVN